MRFVSDRLNAVPYLIGCGDDVDADNLFSQDRLGVDAAESSAKFSVLGQCLKERRKNVN